MCWRSRTIHAQRNCVPAPARRLMNRELKQRPTGWLARNLLAVGVCCLFVSASVYVHQPPSMCPSAVSRLDVLHAVFTGSVRVDAYRANTGDVAEYEGHLYSDKAPGTAVLALPAFAVAESGAQRARRQSGIASRLARLELDFLLRFACSHRRAGGWPALHLAQKASVLERCACDHLGDLLGSSAVAVCNHDVLARRGCGAVGSGAMGGVKAVRARRAGCGVRSGGC